jgi:putative phage-type endonuclease
MKDKGCYYLVDTTQGSRDWYYMRKGRLTASRLGEIVGHSPFSNKTPEELAKYIKGELKENFSEESKIRMDLGNKYEPKVRNMLAKKLNVKIDETGFAIWKKDMRFGASLDGIINDDIGIEIKCPLKMYGPIKDYLEKGNFDENNISHIWKSQYDQITANGVITGRKNMIFCVYSIEEKKLFYQNVKVDYNYWDTFLYPKACEFYDSYMKN